MSFNGRWNSLGIAFCFVGLLAPRLAANAEGGLQSLNLKARADIPKAWTENLHELKSKIEQKQWPACAISAEKALKQKFPLELKGFLATHWLQCAQQADASLKNGRLLEKPLTFVKKNLELLIRGPAAVDLSAQYLMSLQARLDREGKSQDVNPKTLQKYLEDLDEVSLFMERMDRDKKNAVVAQIREIVGGLSGSSNRLPSPVVDKDLETLSEDSASSSLKDVSKEITKMSEAESELLNLIIQPKDKEEESKDPRNSLRLSLQFLNLFPLSVKAKWVNDRVADILQKQSASKSTTVTAQQIAEVFKNTDPLRTFEYAKALFRSARYELSAALVHQANLQMSRNSWTPLQVGASLLLEGKASEISGNYEQAESSFLKFKSLGSSSEDFSEAQFRLGLCYFREKKFKESARSFQELLSSATSARLNSDKYDLLARYWLVRSWQMQKEGIDEKVLNQNIELIINRYAWTYYGLRLRIEKNSGKLSLQDFKSNALKVETKFQTTPGQIRLWKTLEILASSGWQFEAAKVYSFFIGPSAPGLKLGLAKRLAELGLFQPAMKLVNETLDSRPDWQDLNQLSFVFPNPFGEPLQILGKKYSMDPILFNSLIRQESAFSNRALSSSSALGLMQLIPPTAQEEVNDLNLKNVRIPEDVYRPEVNLQMGTHYIFKMVTKFNKCVPCGVAAYNVGPVKLDLFLNARPELRTFVQQPTSSFEQEIWFDELPWSETSFYVKAILRNIFLYKTLAQSEWSSPPVLWSEMLTTRRE
jgi:soluble lytic murein transglycosylase